MDYVREDLQIAGCDLQASHSIGGGDPRTGQLGGLPQSVCCKAPDLQIGMRVMTE